jgi:hypothetical protein
VGDNLGWCVKLGCAGEKRVEMGQREGDLAHTAEVVSLFFLLFFYFLSFSNLDFQFESTLV